MTEELALLPGYLAGHLQLSILALVVCTGVGVPLGVAATRLPWLERIVLGAAALIQTIPGLALLAAMVPLLAALGLPSIGFLPAIVALSLYGALPVLRNTVTGVRSVAPAIREAARGVGMTDRQSLLQVELPLALPVIVAGVRTATVWIVGIATLSTPVGYVSLGNFIFAGLQTRNFDAVALGCVASAALALGLDAIVRLAERGAAARRRGPVLMALLVLVAAGAWATVTGAGTGRDARGGRALVIGAKTFTESYILSEIAGQLLTRAGYSVRTKPSLGSTVVFDALRSGEIDAYVDYSGTIWSTVLHHRTGGTDRAAVLRSVGRELRERWGIGVAASLGFENAYALAMRERDARAGGVRTISDLARIAPRLTMGADYEFFARPEWRGIERIYGLGFAARRSMDPGLMYQAAGQGTVDVISAFSTDGRIDAFGLRVLEDDRRAIPPYDAILLVSRRLARERPEAVRELAQLDGAIDAARMRAMNARVDEGGRTPAAVAREFLRTLRLRRGAPPPDTPERLAPAEAGSPGELRSPGVQ